MRYIYNEDVSGIVNGVIFYFDKGDDQIARDTIRVIIASKQLPTSLVWEGVHLKPIEALQLINSHLLDDGFLGIRFMADKELLMRGYLSFLRKQYSVLSWLADEIDNKVFGVRQ